MSILKFTGALLCRKHPHLYYNNYSSKLNFQKYRGYTKGLQSIAGSPVTVNLKGQNQNRGQARHLSTDTVLKESLIDLQKRSPLLEDSAYNEFLQEYPQVVQDAVDLHGNDGVGDLSDWIRTMFDYNVPHGKQLRATLMLAVALQATKKTGKNLPHLNRIAWMLDTFQGFATIVDDMVDQSKTRRDRPCWYLVNNVGLNAITHSLLMESSGYVLLKHYLKGHYPLYMDIMELWQECALKALYGQELDGRISGGKQYDSFTMDVYSKMMSYKNGYYTFHAPVAVGLLLNGVNDADLFRKLEKTTLGLGLFYSIQDDFLDCFVDPKKSGKIGTDIEDGKPSWLIVNALERACKEQREFLIENYGQKDPDKVAKIKDIYVQLELPQLFSKYEKSTIQDLLSQMHELPEIVPKEPLQKILAILNGRKR